ncbi:MAG: exodeoxyribonuclease VII small subunit [Acidobacteriota bacterium]|nr:exodeoxyribonuclease VII small subunit [Thermoanaerobaculaceae bacterium]
MKKTKKAGFEEKLKELEEIAEKLNEPDCPLEKSLELFEKGVNLSRQLHQELNQAKLRVKKLIGENDTEELKEDLFENAPINKSDD